MGANWNILQPIDVAGAVNEGFEQGRKRQLERRRNEAIDAYTASPDDPQAWAAMVKADPAVAIKLSEVNDRRAYNNALGEYLSGSETNALARVPSQTPAMGGPASQQPQMNALMPAPAPQMQQAQQPTAMQTQQPVQQPADDGMGDLRSAIGEPQNGRDQAFLRMLRHDPVKALKLQTGLRDNFLKRVKGEHDLLSLAVAELSRVDEANWQPTVQRLMQQAAAAGMDLTGELPDTYPGPEGIRAIMEKALPVRDKLNYWLREANMEADNARADRNADSMTADRQARRTEDRRYHNTQDATRRRGQDVRSGDTRRGQDVRGTSARLKPKRAVRPTATGPNGEKVEWNGKAWVPLQ